MTTKLPGITKRKLREYLAANPQRQHVCNDESKCLVADFYVDNGALDGFPTGSTLSVGTSFVTVYGPGGSLYTGQLLFERRHKVWVKRIIRAFDELRHDGGGRQRRFRSTTVLKRLARELQDA